MKLLNTEHTYKLLAPFKTIEQLNENTKVIRMQFKDYMTSSMLKVLDVLHCHAAKYFGVCWLAKSTIAEMVGLSARQVVRICNALVDMGIIVQYELKRANGDKRQSSNAIVFLTQIAVKESFEKIEENSTQKTECHTVCQTDTLTQTPKKINNNTRDTGENASLIKDGLVSKLPKTLKHALAPFFDAEKLYELVGVVYKAKASVSRSVVIEEHEYLYQESILSVINAYKRGKIKSIQGVLYRAIQKTTSSILYNMNRKERMSAYYGL